jgi:hypothetical protein
MSILRDAWRALLAIFVGVALIEAWRNPEQQQEQRPVWQQPHAMSYNSPPAVATSRPAAERPLRRVAGAVVDLADSIIGVVR